MANTDEMAPSPRQPLNRQGVLRIPGFGRTQTLTTRNSPGTATLTNLRIGTINVATVKNKEEEIVEVMKMRNLSILAMSETRLRGKGDRILHDNYRLLYSGGEGARHGVGFIIEPNTAQYVEKVVPVNDRLIGIDIKLEHGFSMIQVYAPQQGRPLIEKEEFYQQLQGLVDEVKYQDNIIVCGDFNGHVGCDRRGYERNIGFHSIGDRNEAGQRILDFSQLNNLHIMNTFYQHRDSHKWTWYRYNQQQGIYTQKSMIDLFLTNNKTIFADVKAVPSLSMDADHRLVIAKIKIRKPNKGKAIGAKRYNIGKLREQTTFEKFQETVNTRLQEYMGEEGDNIESIWVKFRNAITDTSDEVLGEKRPYRGDKRRTPWWGEEVSNSIKAKLSKFRKWMKTRLAEDRLEYIQARNEAQRVKRKAKEDSWKRIGEELKSDFNGTKKLLYNLANDYRGKRHCVSYTVKDKDNQLLTEPEKIAERWREYFYGLLNEPNIQVTHDDFEDDFEEEEDEHPITMNEITAAINKMKNGKTPGEDGLPVEVLRAGGARVVEEMFKIFSTAYRTETVPSDWQKGVIRPILKKGENTVCDNHRGITLLSHVGKIYTRIIEARLLDSV